MEEEDWDRLEACYPPETSYRAWQVFEAINSNWKDSAKFLSGMAISFMGVNKKELSEIAHKFNGVELDRYKYYITMFTNKISKIYNKEVKDGK